ncbi:unnamed protein product [Orchesella dallaii]|uniref:Uncharacterized protein n=1 Tax=Orchesella dallaii TaxID=48710 RepID=A0ABP1PSB4_9HEXA
MPKSDPTTPTTSKGLRSGKPYQNVIDHLVTIRRRKAKNTKIPSPIPQRRINTPQNTEVQVQSTPSTSKRQYAEVLKTPTTSADDALEESKSRIDALIAHAHAAIQRGGNQIPTSTIGYQKQQHSYRITPPLSINSKNPELINVCNSENSDNQDTSTSENAPTHTMDIDEVTALINQRVAEAIQANDIEHEATQKEKDTELERLRIDNDVLSQKLQNPSPIRALTSALSGLGIVAANAITAEKPKFKEGRTPPEEFLRDVEGFLTSHGFRGGSQRGEPDRGGRGHGPTQRGGYHNYSDNNGNNYDGTPRLRGSFIQGRGDETQDGSNQAMNNGGRGINPTQDFQRGGTYPYLKLLLECSKNKSIGITRNRRGDQRKSYTSHMEVASWTHSIGTYSYTTYKKVEFRREELSTGRFLDASDGVLALELGSRAGGWSEDALLVADHFIPHRSACRSPQNLALRRCIVEVTTKLTCGVVLQSSEVKWTAKIGALFSAAELGTVILYIVKEN